MKPLFLRPPLRDPQRERAQWYCRICGLEQYQTDIPVFRRGWRICARCAAGRMEEGCYDAV